MVFSCACVGGGGRYSSFDTGSTSSGSPSHWSGQDRLHLIIPSPLRFGGTQTRANLNVARVDYLLLLDDLERAAHRRMDAAVVGDDLAGLVAVGLIDRDRPRRLVLDAADRRRAEAELRRVEVDRAPEARGAVGQRERGPGG